MKATKKDECSYSFSNAIRTLAMVREAGVEPARPCEHWHLKPASLPIPPLARGLECTVCSVHEICYHILPPVSTLFFLCRRNFFFLAYRPTKPPSFSFHSPFPYISFYFLLNLLFSSFLRKGQSKKVFQKTPVCLNSTLTFRLIPGTIRSNILIK